ncbi:MAG: nicotinate phosphoribosyltransferase [Polyangiaceae bacterium]|nr:nicotinate phosphoribosyltransferase [Polyangiaceae bacterium]
MGADSNGLSMVAPAVGLLTDLYELTMASSYLQLGANDTAVFSLFARKLPANRRMLIACGIEEALRRLEAFRFDTDAIEYLRSTDRFRPADLDYFARVRFTGDVWAVPEGAVVFENEPILEVRAPMIEAQLVETLLLNAVHYATAVASKGARCVAASNGRPVVEFGLRRTPGLEAGLIAARATYLVGFESTSNVLAGYVYELPVSGTVAHSFIEAFDTEADAFRAVGQTTRGRVTLLVDTYDTLHGVRSAIASMRDLRASGRRVSAIRLDSGDLDALSRASRALLDAAGFGDVRIYASGGLDEMAIDRLVSAKAPIDAYGVGTRLAMASDAPVLDMAYKIVEYAGQPCLKLSDGKSTLAFPKQVWRRLGEDGQYAEDILGLRGEPPPTGAFHPLLERVVLRGERCAPVLSLAEQRAQHAAEIARFQHYRSIEGRDKYPVGISDALMTAHRRAVASVRRREGLLRNGIRLEHSPPG